MTTTQHPSIPKETQAMLYDTMRTYGVTRTLNAVQRALFDLRAFNALNSKSHDIYEVIRKLDSPCDYAANKHL